MDNTLYDWVAYFVPAVRALIAEASRLLQVDTDSLRKDLREVHIRYANTEHPYALLETRMVEERLPGLTMRERHEALRPAFDAFNDVRTEHLCLYPTVADTLEEIRVTGCHIVGHTEATDVNIASRIRKLGLGSLLQSMYAPRFAGPPHPLGSERVRIADAVPMVLLPSSGRKPDPEVVRRIVDDHRAPAAQCLYVGDSLAKDIAMAKRAGLLAAWARYGTQHDEDLWAELINLSHWDDRSIAAAVSGLPSAEPDVTLNSFDELLASFVFRG
jgi:FMN phosphatase YigB (HAD superfamily)